MKTMEMSLATNEKQMWFVTFWTHGHRGSCRCVPLFRGFSFCLSSDHERSRRHGRVTICRHCATLCPSCHPSEVRDGLSPTACVESSRVTRIVSLRDAATMTLIVSDVAEARTADLGVARRVTFPPSCVASLKR